MTEDDNKIKVFASCRSKGIFWLLLISSTVTPLVIFIDENGRIIVAIKEANKIVFVVFVIIGS